MLKLNERLKRARELRTMSMINAAEVTDEQALTVPSLFPAWKVGVAVNVGDRLYYEANDQLYKVVQAHTTQADWTPDAAPSLFSPIGHDDSGFTVWIQPTGAHDAYNKGDIVNYNGTLYQSLIDGNTYSPEAYPAGWAVYTEE